MRDSAAAEAHAIAVLQQVAVMCDETRRCVTQDPARIDSMLEAYEDTLATLAPTLERIGQTPSAAFQAVLDAARHAADRHQAMLDAMTLELERLGRAITEANSSATALHGYSAESPTGSRSLNRLG